MKSFLALICFVLLSFYAYSQAAGNYFFNQSKKESINRESSGYYEYAQQSYVSVTSSDTAFNLETSAMMNVKADEFVIYLGTSQIAESLEECHQLINKRIESFKQALSTIGISHSDIYIDYISQFPIFEIEVEKKLFSKTYHEVPSGYELKKNIHIRYTKPELAEKIMLEAAKNEIFDIIKVDYIVKNPTQIYDSLRHMCIKNIQKKVADFQKLGIKTESNYQLVFEKMNATYPIERYSTYAEFTKYTSNLAKMGNKVITRYNVPSLYYNMLHFKSFESVVNPVVIEPVVQYEYTLRVRYVLKKR